MNFSQTFFKYFPTPYFLSMDHVGVDISEVAVRFVELKRSATTRALSLGRFNTYPFTQPIMANEPIASNKELISILGKMKQEYKLSLVEVSIPEDEAYLFTMEVNKGTEESIHNNIEFHLEENVPISLADAVYDYHVIKENPQTKTMLIAVSVILQSLADDYITLFNTVGLTPITFLIESQALARSLVKRGDNSTYLIVHLHSSKTVLSVVSDGSAQFTSTINIGSEDFTQAIMKEFSVSKEEAEKIKQEKGFSHDKVDGSVFQSLINTAGALRDEINRVYFYWQSSLVKSQGVSDKVNGGASVAFPRSPVSKILLAGKDSSLVGFRDYLAVSIRTKVELAGVWTNVFSFDQEIPQIKKSDSLDYGTAIGLALITRDSDAQ